VPVFREPDYTMFGGAAAFQQQALNSIPESMMKLMPTAWGMQPRYFVKIALLHPDAKIPVYAKEGDSGFDLIALEDVMLKPREITFIPLGFALEIPHGLEVQVRSRSGLSGKLITVANSPGTVDSGYRGEVAAIIYNANESEFFCAKGSKIAQGVLTPVYEAVFVETDQENLTPSDRGEGGFGHTGS
jgi:dUTP pyrophosphatase